VKNVEIKNDSMIALSPNEKKYIKTTDLSLYLKRLVMVQAVIIPDEIANCKGRERENSMTIFLFGKSR
jgi:hypothetical protein